MKNFIFLLFAIFIMLASSCSKGNDTTDTTQPPEPTTPGSMKPICRAGWYPSRIVFPRTLKSAWIGNTSGNRDLWEGELNTLAFKPSLFAHLFIFQQTTLTIFSSFFKQHKKAQSRFTMPGLYSN